MEVFAVSFYTERGVCLATVSGSRLALTDGIRGSVSSADKGLAYGRRY
jgi:hypothetical protein